MKEYYPIEYLKKEHEKRNFLQKYWLGLRFAIRNKGLVGIWTWNWSLIYMRYLMFKSKKK